MSVYEQKNVRIESDSMGEIEVPADHYWGAQTQRSLILFGIGCAFIPIEVIRTLAIIKKAAAMANRDLRKLSEDKADLIMQAAEEVLISLSVSVSLLQISAFGPVTI